jgi:hypothetical protein
MPTTRHLAILALFISTAALFFAVTDFPGAGDSSATNPAAILLPAQTLAKTLQNSNTQGFDGKDNFWIIGGHRPQYQYYTHQETGLNFPHRKEFRLFEIHEDGGELILLENSERGAAFQIFIQPWDEPGPLTVERIRRDLPDMHMEAVSETTTYKSDDPMLTFLSMDETLGPIPQAWFIYNGSLFQLAMYAPGDPEELLYPWFNGFLQHISFTSPS